MSYIKIYQITKDNKPRQFLFKILHRIIITKKELKKFNIATDDYCNLCSGRDYIMHTFLECDVSISLFSSTIIKWFNDIHKLNGSPCVEQILFNLTDEIASLTPIQKRRLVFSGFSWNTMSIPVRFFPRTPIFLNFKPNSKCNGRSNLTHWLDFVFPPSIQGRYCHDVTYCH